MKITKYENFDIYHWNINKDINKDIDKDINNSIYFAWTYLSNVYLLALQQASSGNYYNS